MWISLSRRNRQPEMMDQPDLPADVHGKALLGLARLNWLSGSSRNFWPALRQLAQSRSEHTVRVLDVACGGGDVMIALANKARRAGYDMEFVGCDVSEVALSIARKNAKPGDQRLRFFQANVIESEFPAGFDAIVCSLFLHHLTDSDAEDLLRRMGLAADRLVMVDDLVRSRSGYALALLASRLLVRSPIVHLDGPLSVAGAFAPDDVLLMAKRAGWAEAVLSRHWPQRFLLQWWKP